MPRVELPSGKWVEYRSELMADDKFAVQGSFEVRVVDGQQVMPSGVTNLMRNALLADIITEWGGPGLEGIPVPSQNIAGAGILGKVLPIKDYNVLSDEVEPLLQEVSFSPNRQRAATTPSSNSSPSS